MVDCIFVQAYQHKIPDYFLNTVVDSVHLVTVNENRAPHMDRDEWTNRSSVIDWKEKHIGISKMKQSKYRNWKKKISLQKCAKKKKTPRNNLSNEISFIMNFNVWYLQPYHLDRCHSQRWNSLHLYSVPLSYFVCYTLQWTLMNSRCFCVLSLLEHCMTLNFD